MLNTMLNAAVDPITVDLLLTLWAAACLLGLWVAAAVVLPWSPEQFEELDEELEQLRRVAVPQPAFAPRRG
ncbi:MAG: hypothetical protein H6741_04505 [Alphaproteobacteria bacterium]|nr:hypothetical protein [Alphaproteobacteria bacterium]